MDTDTRHPSRQDHALLRSALLRLTATPKIIIAIVVIAVVIVWFQLLTRVLAFGGRIDYAGLHVMGAEATALLQRYNPFFWWALVALCTLLIAWLVFLFGRATMRRARLRAVDEASFARLAEGLSAPALDVLLWAWQERDEPLRVGDLQRAKRELGANRAGKLQRAARQLAVLELAQRSR